VAAVLAVGMTATSATWAAELPVKDGQKIAFMGDSITQQGAGANGYVRLVISGLEANGVKATAIPAGISGHKSNQMLERLGRDVLSNKPDWMTLSCGVNDVWHGAKGVPLDQYKANITKMVEQCQAAGVKVMILTSTMIGEDQANANNQKLVAYNEFLRTLAKEKNCLLADLNAEMQAALAKAGNTAKKGNVLTRDGVHMNPAGNEMMATGVLKGFGLDAEQIAKAQKCWAGKAEESKAEVKEETKEHRDARMGWWREAKFGMFIHWGVYSVPAGTFDGKQIGGIGEWIMNRGKIPVARYAEYAKEFNPAKFNAQEWVKIAKDAGMKYIVITSKHHDGFAMFHSKTSPYNIYDATPFKRDPLKELAEACRKEGIKLGFYYSQNQDWHHPGGDASGGHWDKAQDGDYTKYIDEIAVPQVKEILSNYGEFPAVLWWDTSGKISKENATKLYKVVQELKPNIIMNNRLGGGYKGDTETPEQKIPATGYPGRDWETCMTMNGTWGFKSYDQSWKSTETLIRNLADIASKGGNYLLNVGPTSEGLIPEPSIERLKEVGAWMKVNGEAVYGTSASVFPYLSWGRCTSRPGKLYLHVFNWPADGQLDVPGRLDVKKAYLLAAADQSLTATADGLHTKIKLPASAPDKIDSVLCLEINGAPELDPSVKAPAEPKTPAQVKKRKKK
jgi:alpha-L-fucosidase